MVPFLGPPYMLNNRQRTEAKSSVLIRRRHHRRGRHERWRWWASHHHHIWMRRGHPHHHHLGRIHFRWIHHVALVVFLLLPAKLQSHNCRTSYCYVVYLREYWVSNIYSLMFIHHNKT